jgi:hypothetical protein
MNDPHDPNVTWDIAAAPADCLRVADALASTDGSLTGADQPAGDVPASRGTRRGREVTAWLR